MLKVDLDRTSQGDALISHFYVTGGNLQVMVLAKYEVYTVHLEPPDCLGSVISAR